MHVPLIVGAGNCDRALEDAEALLLAYRTDDGLRYLDYQPVSDPDHLVPDDLAVTILINSRVASRAFKAVQDRSREVVLADLPRVPLEQTDSGQRQRVADVVTQVAQWPGFAASVATKVLHKKRHALIPILDNQAIFGAYMSPSWPGRRSSTDSVKSPSRIREAIDWIFTDLTRPENVTTWARLAEIEPTRSRIQLFDMVWWSYFRRVEPIPSTSSRPLERE
ncbi:MAG: hypothetical protein QOI54_2995 [Actinomycetota bacterium]|nr:hypothetical protein [Actinomycetota bacterium]